MALAILQLLAFEKGDVRFNIDTGTNRYYQLKIGRSSQHKYGIDWVDEVFFSTHVSINDRGGNLLNSSKDISIPINNFNKGNAYVQLFSFKTAEGKSPAFSRVVKVPMGFGVPVREPTNFVPSFSIPESMKTTEPFNPPFKPPRKIPCRTYSDVYAHQASLEDLLAGIINLAAPTILNLRNGVQNLSRQNEPSRPIVSNGTMAPANLLTLLLNTILGSVSGTAGSSTSQQQSLNGSSVYDNRFLNIQNSQFSRPFIFGIDDALLGTLIGPVVQLLPQLLNAANQRRVQMKQADNKLVTDILSEVNRRMLLEQLLQAQRQGPVGEQPGNAADLNQLIQLLQQMPAAQQQGATGTSFQPAAIPVTKSLTLEAGYSSTLSSKAVVSFVTAEPVPWNGMQKVLFAKNQGLQLKVQLNVTDPVPKTPLPKAILKIIFKDSSNQSIYYEKTFKQKDVSPNSVMTLPFSQNELSHLPVNRTIGLFAEVRWLSVGACNHNHSGSQSR